MQYTLQATGGRRLTWNWALMLGAFFFLCRSSRDLVMRSWSVTLLRCLKERTLSSCLGRLGLDLEGLLRLGGGGGGC